MDFPPFVMVYHKRTKSPIHAEPIQLITANMPKGKSFAALKEELETDLFSKISDSELEVFDNSTDLNIARKKSIYGSILYSYNHLLENEKRAFELLSLFPDGIGLEIFKKLTNSNKNTQNSSHNELQQTMITDKIIKALENKSMIENNSGQIKLQSIVGKFAEAQLRQRDNLASFYRNAFEFNRMFARTLIEQKEDNERRVLIIFDSQQGNFLKSITYLGKVDIESEMLLDYLDDLSGLFVGICSLGGFIRELSARADDFQGDYRRCIDVILLHSRYFDGDFNKAFIELKQLVPLKTLYTLDKTITSQLQLVFNAFNIYEMEGEALYTLNYFNKNKHNYKSYPSALLYLGEFNRQLAENSIVKFSTLEARANMGLLSALEEINLYISELYDKAHLERMQVSYTRAKLVPLKLHEIEPLITVNPYTRGLKRLMLAFIEPNIIKANELFKEAISHLWHIKYYYVEALYLYAEFLHINKLAECKVIYNQGLELAQNHHYRFLQYRFEQLLNPTNIAYDSCNYPLPENEDFADFIKFLIKQNKHTNKI